MADWHRLGHKGRAARARPLHHQGRAPPQRAIDFWKVLDQNRQLMDQPMERAGRKANPLGTVELAET